MMVIGSFLAASLAQWIAYWVVSLLCGWTYSMPFHLYWKGFPSDPKIISLVKGDRNSKMCVEHVTGEEKYE